MTAGASLEPKRLRVAVLNRQFSATGGGAERYSIALVEHLAARHDIHVFAQHIDHSWPGVSYHKVAQPLKRPRWLNQLWYATATWWATRKGFDVVHSHENSWHGQVQTVHVLPVKYNLLHGLRGMQLAMRWLKIITSPRLLVYLALERSRFSLRGSRVIVLPSKTLMPQMLEAYPACAPAIEVITPGVDKVWGQATPLQKVEARRQLGLPEADFCILFVGNDYRKKGLSTLIQALQQLPGQCFVAVVGNPAHVPVFQSQVKSKGLAQRVFFLGSISDVVPAYQAADVLAHPTHEDTFAMVVLEAMAHGLPVVASGERYCGIAALLTHEANAMVLEDPLDVQGLSTALARLQQQPDLYRHLSDGALHFARQHQWTTLALQQENSYRRVAQRAQSQTGSCKPNL
ncbi:glycosyltransferase family 4 protein [Rhodoferax sp.]|uniref:glycosyltransferase family 4 protein n=1 Tax=Rhodoferax sp. TaxID=50421 RepID=UPI00271B9AAD|nr:glycosyltransferase family 4 protein [Rhodoferax sp.]MDO8320099.1 glycosyltransferase family 4 protein [Rhodoferax sp.]